MHFDEFCRDSDTFLAASLLSAFHKLSSLYLLTLKPLSAFDFQTCLAEAREAKVLERGAPSVTGRSFVTTSKESPSQPFDVSLAVVV